MDEQMYRPNTMYVESEFSEIMAIQRHQSREPITTCCASVFAYP